MPRFCFVIFALFLFISCGNPAETDGPAAPPVPTVKRPVLSDSLLQRLQQTLVVYFELQENFVAGDTAPINRTARRLAAQLDRLSLAELQLHDTLLYTQVHGRPGDAVAELAAMVAEKELQQKQASFEMVSTVLYDLLKTLQPQGVKVYHQYCPMAFDDKGAYWLSAADSIRNPYFGNKMLRCGENKEVLAW